MGKGRKGGRGRNEGWKVASWLFGRGMDAPDGGHALSCWSWHGLDFLLDQHFGTRKGVLITIRTLFDFLFLLSDFPNAKALSTNNRSSTFR